MKKQPDDHWLTAAEAAESLRITARAFRAWQVEPIAVIGRNKYYTGAAILENRMATLKRKRRRPETTTAELKSKVDELETALTNARAAGQALRNAELRGELVHLDALTEAVGNAGTASAAALEALPGRIKRSVPEINGAELLDLRRVIAKARNQAADLDPSTLDYEVSE